MKKNSKNVLIVDDSKAVCKILQEKIQSVVECKCFIAYTKQEAKKLLQQQSFYIAIIDLSLPDAKDAEVVDLSINLDIPTVVLTGSANVEKILRKKSIIDFVVKDNSNAFEYVASIVKLVIYSYQIKALIVDDSPIILAILEKLLKRYNIKPISASNGEEALDILSHNEDIKIIFTDYNMPKIDGVELVKRVRKIYTKEQLPIVAVSNSSNKKTVSQFLKYGANDFIYKGFTPEEFFARLHSILDMMQLIEQLQEMANKDFLTGAYNRRYFFKHALKQYEKNGQLYLFMIDIDKFKLINDTYGHDIGDLALKESVKLINHRLKDIDHITARFGGEEFCTVITDMSEDTFMSTLTSIKDLFENNKISTEIGVVSFTISIGYVLDKYSKLEDMINAADTALYRAKNSGRNQIQRGKL